MLNVGTTLDALSVVTGAPEPAGWNRATAAGETSEPPEEPRQRSSRDVAVGVGLESTQSGTDVR